MAIFVLSAPLKAERFNQFIDWDDLSGAEIHALRQKIKKQGIINDYELLKEVKYLLLNGNKEIAETLLKRVTADEKGILLLKNKLLALVHFLNSDFEKSLEILNLEQFQNDFTYKNICLLKFINLILLDKSRNIYSEFSRCSNLTSKFAHNDHLWLEVLLSVRTEEGVKKSIKYFTDSVYFKGLTSNLSKSILWLKMVIYLNREKDAYPLLNLFPSRYYKSARFKETLAFIYYRLGDFALAEKLITDLEGTNAENMRGNIRLKEEKYELAYGHFLLALKKKENSKNALERLLPLTWILGKWDDGIKFLNYFPNTKSNGRNKRLIEVVLLIRKRQFKKATKIINDIFPLEAVGQPLKVNQLISYLSLLSGDEQRATRASARACRQYDGLHCWILFQLQRYDLFSDVLKKDKKITEYFPLNFSDLKKEVKIESIKEPVYINQEDIEELDENLIKIHIK